MSKVSKVVLGNETIMDITDSTVNENNLLDGEVGYGSDGERVVGRVVIPTVNDGVLTIQKNGTTVQTFSANQNTDVTVDITVPTTAADVGAIPTTQKGVASGVAELDATGKVPSSQLPSFVDDTVEGYLYEGHWYSDAQHTQEVVGETGKIYVELSTNKTYRWSGTTFVEISESLALGETSSTAYRGDRGATAYSHATDANKVSSATAAGLYKVGATAEGHISELQAVQKSDITNLGIPGSVPDIVDNLNSTDATKTLSAKQGKVLKDAIDAKSSVLILTITQDEQTGDLVCDKLPSEVTAAYSNGAAIQAKAMVGEDLMLSLIYVQDRSFFFGTSVLSIEEGGISSLGVNLLKDSSNDAWESIEVYDDRVTNPKIATISKNGNVYSCDLTPDEIDYAINFCAGIVLHYSENGVIYNFTLVGYEDKYVFATTVPTLDETGTLTKMFILDPSSQGWNDITFIEYNSSNDPNAIKWSEAEKSVKKNWLPNNAVSKTINGITFTVNSDGSVLVNGTNTASDWATTFEISTTLLKAGEYYLSQSYASEGAIIFLRLRVNNSMGASIKELGNKSQDTFLLSNDTNVYCDIQIRPNGVVNNVVIKPMIRLASVQDSTYIPYIPDNTELVDWKSNGVLGAKNLLPNLADSNITTNGVTMTVNSDGSITFNGTATANADFIIVRASDSFAPPKGNYIFSTNVDNSNIQMRVEAFNGTTWVKFITAAVSPASVNLDYVGYTNISASIRVNSGVTLNNVTFKPMLRLASDTDTTYQPYAKTNQILTKDVIQKVSWSGASTSVKKNYIDGTKPIGDVTTINGLTFTVNSDKSVTINGTATAITDYVIAGFWNSTNILVPSNSYILSLGASTVNEHINIKAIYVTTVLSSTYTSGTFNAPNGITELFIRVDNGAVISNVTVHPMLRLASVQDDTYVPFIYDNKELDEKKVDWEEQNVLGAKNLLPNDIPSTPFTKNGITFTRNADGSITCEGTATDDMWVGVYRYSSIGNSASGDGFLKPGKYILSGCPAGGGTTTGTYRMYLQVRNSTDTGEEAAFSDLGNSVTFDITSTYASRKCRVLIAIRSGCDLTTPVTFYPMIRYASIMDTTYEPYSMSNIELTDEALKLLGRTYTLYMAGDSSKDMDSYTKSLGITTTMTLRQMCELLANSEKNQSVRIIINTNNSGVTSSSSQIIRDLATLFNDSENIVATYVIDVIQVGNGRLTITKQDRELTRIKYIVLNSWSTYKSITTPIEFYLDQTATTSTTTDTVYTFTDARITSSSVIDVYADIFGVSPSNVVTTNGSCTVTFPKQSTAQSMTCRIYIK